MQEKFLLSFFDSESSLSDDMTPDKAMSGQDVLMLANDILVDGDYTRAEIHRWADGHFRRFAELTNTTDAIRLELFERD